MKVAETTLAAMVVESLTEWGWEVYQEVTGPFGRCDIVAKRGSIVWAIECKTSFGLAVMEQAHNWTRYANYSSVAVPIAPGRFGEKMCRTLGIGVLWVRVNHEEVSETVRPKLNRKILNLKLHEEQKTFCPAGSTHGHWTPFKRTVRALVLEVRNHPGIHFDKLIKEIDHHYSSFSSAKSCLRGFIGTVIPELRVEIVDRKLCVFPVDL